MSGEGSDFSESDGEFLQESTSKRLRLHGADPSVAGNAAVDSPTKLLRLHTEWVQRDDRANAYHVGGESDGPIPVPQSDFEIEINSSGQEGGASPGQEISLPSTSITIPVEPRILTIDTQLTSDSTSHALANPHEATITTTVVTNLQSESIQANLGDEIHVPGRNPSATGQHDFSSLMAVATGGGRANLMQVHDQQSLMAHELPGGQFIQTAGDTGQGSGPLYVMIPPSSGGAEILQAMQHGQGQRPLMPRLSSDGVVSPPMSDDNRKHKELMRKQTHNEVERRRRDRINELIKVLAEIVPGCQKKDAANGNVVGYVYSKGTVLEKTVEYVKELLLQNEQLSSTAKLAEKSANAMQILQNQITVLEKENTFLRAQMVHLGIENTPGALGARNFLTNPLAQSLLNTAQVPTASPISAVPNTTQLLVSLAQTLTTNPLLASLAQTSSVVPGLPQSVVSSATNGTQVSPSQPQLTGGNNQANLLMNSLVQTLASIAGNNNPPPQPPIPPQSAGLSATAAMSLLNSLIMAQSALTATTHTSPATVSIPSSLSSTPTNPSVNLLVAQGGQDKNVS